MRIIVTMKTIMGIVLLKIINNNFYLFITTAYIACFSTRYYISPSLVD